MRPDHAAFGKIYYVVMEAVVIAMSLLRTSDVWLLPQEERFVFKGRTLLIVWKWQNVQYGIKNTNAHKHKQTVYSWRFAKAQIMQLYLEYGKHSLEAHFYTI